MPEHTSTPKRLAYSVDEAAAMLGIGRTLAFHLIRQGELPSVTVGRRRIVTHEALLAYLANRSEDRPER